MKIYNRTRIADSILESVLKVASLGIGVRTSGVIVKTNVGIYGYSRGNAVKCICVKIKGRWIETDGGRIMITLPTLSAKSNIKNFISCAVNFFNTAKHEWSHIRDFQNGVEIWSIKNNNRRPKWQNRPEEIRAENYVYESKTKGYNEENAYEEIMNLTIALEKFYK